MIYKNTSSSMQYVWHSVFFIIWCAVLILGLNFTLSDEFTGIYDDSGLYLIAAHIYGNLPDAPEAYIDIYTTYRHLPPGFPLVLAMSGAYSDIYYAHALVLIEFLLFLFFLYKFYCQKLGDIRLAIVLLLAFISLPSVWIELLKVMSEGQYMLVSYAALYFYSGIGRRSTSGASHVMLGLLLALLVLTRMIGVALFLSYIVVYISQRRPGFGYTGLVYMLPAFLVPILIWLYVSSDYSGGYSKSYDWLFLSDGILEGVLGIVSRNMDAFIYAWKKIFFINISDAGNYRVYLLYGILMVSVAGFVKSRREVHAVYVLVYLSILTVWPYPSEMDRFIYPIVPLIIMYALIGLKLVTKVVGLDVIGINQFGIQVIAALVMISLSFPSSAFIYKRYELGKEFYGYNVSHMPILYVEKDAGLAFSSALIAKRYIDSIRRLPGYIKKDDFVLSLKPEVVTYISQIKAKRLPEITNIKDADIFVNNVLASGASHIIITGIAFHSDPLGMGLLSVISPHANIVFEKKSDITGKTTLVLLEIHE